MDNQNKDFNQDEAVNKKDQTFDSDKTNQTGQKGGQSDTFGDTTDTFDLEE